MTLLQIFVILAVIGVVAAVVAGLISGGLAPGTSSIPEFELPNRSLTALDLQQVKFTQGLRGYRMAEVDLLLDRLQAELADREPGAELAPLPATAPAELIAPGDGTDPAAPLTPSQTVGPNSSVTPESKAE